MIAPNVPGPLVLTELRERYARPIPASNIDLLPLVLSGFEKQYDNRRQPVGFSLAVILEPTQCVASYLTVRNASERQ